jgi:hypothetical protein
MLRWCHQNAVDFSGSWQIEIGYWTIIENSTPKRWVFIMKQMITYYSTNKLSPNTRE